MTKNQKIAERMVMFVPSELGSDDIGSIMICPHIGDEQPWQLWTRFSDEKSAIKAKDQIRRWITDALDAESETWKSIIAEELEQTKRLIDALGVHDEIAGGKACMDAMMDKIASMKNRDIESLKCVRDNTATALRQAEAASAMCNSHLVYMKQLDRLASHAVDIADTNRSGK